MRVMHSMELDDEEKLDFVAPIPLPDKPEFPFGLRICLTDRELKKCDPDFDAKDAVVGGIFHGHFMARITSVSSNDSPEGECCRVEAQIEDLAIESEDAENED